MGETLSAGVQRADKGGVAVVILIFAPPPSKKTKQSSQKLADFKFGLSDHRGAEAGGWVDVLGVKTSFDTRQNMHCYVCEVHHKTLQGLCRNK